MPLFPIRSLLRVFWASLGIGLLTLSSACVHLVSSAGVTSSASLISSASSSEILSSPFRSSARSSGSEEEQQREQQQQQEEIKIYTASYLATGSGSKGSFYQGLSAIAARRGYSDWEMSPITWIAVGQGFATAGLPPQQVADYAQSWSGGNPAVLALLERGCAMAGQSNSECWQHAPQYKIEQAPRL